VIVRFLGLLDAEPIPDVDQGPIPRPASAIAAVVGPNHSQAGIEQVDCRAVAGLVPGEVAQARTFALGTGGADKFELRGVPINKNAACERMSTQGKAERIAFGVGCAEWFAGVRVPEVVQQYVGIPGVGHNRCYPDTHGLAIKSEA
jgi:hypothetical protein